MAATRLFEARWAGFEHDSIDLLATRSRRLANVVAAISRRKPVREFRARLLLLLLDMRAPLGKRARHDWYVPGAVARMGVDGLRRAWRGYFGEDPMTERTFRSHLTALENACAIVRAPGDWLWTMVDPAHPERRPRFASTIHVLESERSAAWWATRGKELLAKHPRAKSNPDVWAQRFGDWRVQAAKDQLELFAGLDALEIGKEPRDEPDQSAPASAKAATQLEAAKAIAGALRRRTSDPIELLTALYRAGVHVKGRAQFRTIREPIKLAGAAALLAVALARGDVIRNRAGWLLSAFDHSSGQELHDAWKAVRGSVDASTWAEECRGSPKSARGRLIVIPSR